MANARHATPAIDVPPAAVQSSPGNPVCLAGKVRIALSRRGTALHALAPLVQSLEVEPAA